MPSPPSKRPSDARGRRSSAFVRERHASIDARSRPALSRSAGCVKTTTLEALVARSGLAAIAFVTKRAEAKEKEKALAEHVARHPEDVGRTVEGFNWVLWTIVRPPA
jgi:hypothetical protein